MRTKVMFEANVPVTVALEEYPAGRLTEGRGGDQFYYWLTGDRCMYVYPIVEQQIRELGIQLGEEFTICKQVKQEGRRKVTSWHVGLLNGSKPPARPGPSPIPAAAPTVPPAMTRPTIQSQPTTNRRERMTACLADCIASVLDAAGGLKLDNANTQALISTLYIQEGRMEEARLKFGGALPYAQPGPRNQAAYQNGRANGGVQ